MKKLIGIVLVLALAVMLIPSAVFAFDNLLCPNPPLPPVTPPTVSITAGTDRLSNQVNGWFNSGTLNWNIDSTTGTHKAIATIDMNGSAFVNASTSGIDTTTWHPGVVGETNYFQGASNGGFTATYNTSTNGNYGILGTYVNAASKAGGADFAMNDTQSFNIMSGNHAYNVVGNFFAHAAGYDDQVAMNLKSIGSMYVWSEATNPYSAPPLRGNCIEKEVWATQGAVPMTDLYMGVCTSGIATMSNSNIWGWGNNESGILSTTNYGGGTRDVSATGAGTLIQTGFGLNSLTFSGIYTLPGGGSSIPGGFQFNNGISGTYSMTAK